jgi:NAD(P)-dependent dehydrogenase (short-subunit alcohol dehydrogenase family)
VLAVRADVGVLADLDRLVAAVRARFGGLDVLFVNAGVTAFAPVDQASEAHFDEHFAINVDGADYTVQKALPVLRDGASVFFNGSINGLIGMPESSVYAATKAAVRSLARTLSADLKDRHIRVNVISPGPVSTPLYGRLVLLPEQLAAVAAGIRGAGARGALRGGG